MATRRMHADQLPIDAPLVRRLLQHQFPQWADLPLRELQTPGTANALYRLGADKLVRLPLRPPAEPSDPVAERAELDWQQRLAAYLPVAIPIRLAAGRPTAEYPCAWNINNWIDGENPTPGHLEEPETLARDLANVLTTLRRIDPASGPRTFTLPELIARDELMRQRIAQLHDEIDTDAATAAWLRALKHPVPKGSERLSHGDLLPVNVLIGQSRLVALIDWWSPGAIADPAGDLMTAWNLLPTSARSTFRAAMDVDDNTWARARGWALSKGVIGLSYYRDTNAVMAANACYTIQQVLSDPDN